MREDPMGEEPAQGPQSRYQIVTAERDAPRGVVDPCVTRHILIASPCRHLDAHSEAPMIICLWALRNACIGLRHLQLWRLRTHPWCAWKVR